MEQKIISIILVVLFVVALLFSWLGDKTIDKENNMTEANQVGGSLLIREPVVAGTFYPSDEGELTEMVDGLLDKVAFMKFGGNVLGLIAPHAGYAYSGQVAAYAFKTIEGQEVETVVLIGASHNHFFEGASIFVEGFFKTPLGDIEIDSRLAKRLTEESTEINFNKDAHADEHSIEVQLPFLQRILGRNFKIVPILIGGGSDEKIVDILSAALLRNIGDKKVLLVASSDLSHYPAYDDAVVADGEVLGAIASGRVDVLRLAMNSLSEKKVPNAITFACGQRAIETVMEVCGRLSAKSVKIINYANSGDVIGDKNKVVGYGAVAFIKNEEGIEGATNMEEISVEQRDILKQFTKETVERFVRGEQLINLKFTDRIFNQKRGVFVTLKKSGQLRGCVGTFENEKPLWQAVQEMAISAASKDSRFLPISTEELSELSYEISVLTPLSKVKEVGEIISGKHGVKIILGENTGVFLPQVATEMNWDTNKLLENICTEKMGLKKNCWKDKKAEIYIFEAEVF